MKSIYLLNFAEVGTTKDRKQWREMRLRSLREDCASIVGPVRDSGLSFQGSNKCVSFCMCVFVCTCVCVFVSVCIYGCLCVCLCVFLACECLCICVCCVCACVYCQHSGKSLK